MPSSAINILLSGHLMLENTWEKWKAEILDSYNIDVFHV